jgi:hypothetical protein
MSTFIRVLIALMCAYAGSTVAGAQFPELPRASQMAEK